MCLSHQFLVERAARWLANSMSCPVVITEMAGQTEEPDAIGWTTGGGSILVECKTSKSDLKADLWKPGRRTPSRFGVGDRRYYLVPKELLQYTMDNKPEGWGVLVAYKTRVEIKEDATMVSANKAREMSMLISSLRRLAGEKQPLTGMNIKYYTIDSSQNPKATIGLEPFEAKTQSAQPDC